MKKILLLIPAILLLAAGCNSATSSTPTTKSPVVQKPITTAPKTTPITNNTSPQTNTINPKTVATQPATLNITVSADDTAANLTNISAVKGQKVNVTFKVNAQNVYHAGLDFRSSVVNTGPILSGQSKTVSFTADQSFDFTPYWGTTNTKKPYTIHVVVK